MKRTLFSLLLSFLLLFTFSAPVIAQDDDGPEIVIETSQVSQRQESSEEGFVPPAYTVVSPNYAMEATRMRPFRQNIIRATMPGYRSSRIRERMACVGHLPVTPAWRPILRLTRSIIFRKTMSVIPSAIRILCRIRGDLTDHRPAAVILQCTQIT